MSTQTHQYKDLEPDEAYYFKPEDLEEDEMILNMGPQHPSTHGVLRIELKTDGEIVKDARPHIGYLHRNFEKHAENIDYQGVIPFTDRLDYVASMNNSLTYAVAVEKLMGIELNERVQSIRVITSELQRIASHLLAIGTYGLDVGAFTPFLHAFREREKVLDLFEWLCGARLLYNYNWIGGVSHDLPDTWTDRALVFLDQFEPVIDELDELLSYNKIFTKRTADVGIIPPELAIGYALTGPNLRGSGIKWDVRKEDPYFGYEKYDFDVPIGQGRFGPIGSCWDRYYVRVEEMRQSLRITRQAIEKMPAEGDVREGVPKRVKPKPGEAYGRTEAPRGELGFYVVSDGSLIPYRVKARSPCFVAMSLFHELARGEMIADMVAIIGSLDIVLGEIDR
jgi:NADH-quinone oxidoreductase subunit D